MGANLTEMQCANRSLARRPLVAGIVACVPEALIVTGLGSPAYDVLAAGDRHKNYYLWGAMGGATSLGLGLALARPNDSVLVITGDGEMLMGLGSLAKIGAKLPRNLTILVLDNGHYGETGMQRSHASLGTNLVKVAQGVRNCRFTCRGQYAGCRASCPTGAKTGGY
jgi:thiamine pyrophosphate-dependent acetolactate synthase large subunit-like protein